MDVLAFLFSTPTVVGLLLFLGLGYLCYSYVYRPLQYFSVHGIPGPKPVPVFGNLNLVRQFAGNTGTLNKHLIATYGPVCGIFFGMKPFYVICDVDLLKDVTVKHFDKFVNRASQRGFLFARVDGKIHDFISSAADDEWRKRRRILTPAFSAHKMKLMEPLIKESTSRLGAKVHTLAENAETVETTELYNMLTMEVILSTAFGRAIDVQGGKGGKLYEAAVKAFSDFSPDSQKKKMPVARMIQFLLLSFPSLGPLLQWVLVNYTVFGKSVDYLSQSALKIVGARKKGSNESVRKDLLQLMIDASDSETQEGLNEGEIVADCVGFILAGYETTSRTLTFATYLLAANPEAQEKLANEIHEYFDENPDKSMYDASHELQYLDMVIEETLRMYSPATLTIRECNENCILRGVHFEKGVSVFIPIAFLHYDPKLWVDPTVFNPERFAPEEKAKRHPCAYMPFGYGPRNCIGMRFALLEAKMALIEIVSKFRVVLAPETKVPLEVTQGVTLKPKDGLFVKFELRK